MPTQEMLAFVQYGYDAYNAHHSDLHWLDDADTDVAEECEVVDVPSGMILRGPEGLTQFLTRTSRVLPQFSKNHFSGGEDVIWHIRWYLKGARTQQCTRFG